MCIKNFIVKHERDNVNKILKKQEEFRFDLPCKTDYLEKSVTYETTDNPIGYIVDIHGGGLIAGNVGQNDAFCRWLANKGYKVFGIDYPLIPEATFLEQLQFICDAIAEIIEKTPDWHNENKPRFLIGDSAGGYLALITLGLTGYRDRVRDDFDIKSELVKWDGVWFQSPMFNTTDFDAIGLIMSHIYYERGWKKQNYARYIEDPLFYLVADLPWGVVFTSSLDDKLNSHTERAITDIEDMTGDRPICFYTVEAEHDFNVLYPYANNIEKFNEKALDILEKKFF